jgi:hypothetical protein
MGKKFGQFGQTWEKSGQTLEKFSQPWGLNIFFKQISFSKTRINLQQSLGARFLI